MNIILYYSMKLLVKVQICGKALGPGISFVMYDNCEYFKTIMQTIQSVSIMQTIQSVSIMQTIQSVSQAAHRPNNIFSFKNMIKYCTFWLKDLEIYLRMDENFKFQIKCWIRMFQKNSIHIYVYLNEHVYCEVKLSTICFL